MRGRQADGSLKLPGVEVRRCLQHEGGYAGLALEEAAALARRLAAGPLSLSHAKQALALAHDLPEDEQDCKEGVAAFRAKRPPRFSGH